MYCLEELGICFRYTVVGVESDLEEKLVDLVRVVFIVFDSLLFLFRSDVIVGGNYLG